jgi:hypothetical protein
MTLASFVIAESEEEFESIMPKKIEPKPVRVDLLFLSATVKLLTESDILTEQLPSINKQALPSNEEVSKILENESSGDLISSAAYYRYSLTTYLKSLADTCSHFVSQVPKPSEEAAVLSQSKGIKECLCPFS